MFGMVSLGINIGYDEGMSHQKLFDWVKGLIRISDLALVVLILQMINQLLIYINLKSIMS